MRYPIDSPTQERLFYDYYLPAADFELIKDHANYPVFPSPQTSPEFHSVSPTAYCAQETGLPVTKNNHRFTEISDGKNQSYHNKMQQYAANENRSGKSPKLSVANQQQSNRGLGDELLVRVTAPTTNSVATSASKWCQSPPPRLLSSKALLLTVQ